MINAGVYVIDSQLLSILLSHQAIDMPDFLQVAKRSGHRGAACPIDEYWLDMRRPEVTSEANMNWDFKR